MKIKLTYLVGAAGLYYWLFKKPAAAQQQTAGYGATLAAQSAAGIRGGLPGPTPNIAIQGGGMVVTQFYNPITGLTGGVQGSTPAAQPADPRMQQDDGSGAQPIEGTPQYKCSLKGGKWNALTGRCDPSNIGPSAASVCASQGGLFDPASGTCYPDPQEAKIFDPCTAGHNQDGSSLYTGQCDQQIINQGGGSNQPAADAPSKLPMILGGAAALFFLLKR